MAYWHAFLVYYLENKRGEVTNFARRGLTVGAGRIASSEIKWRPVLLSEKRKIEVYYPKF